MAPALILTLILNQTFTRIGGRGEEFSSGAIVWASHYGLPFFSQNDIYPDISLESNAGFRTLFCKNKRQNQFYSKYFSKIICKTCCLDLTLCFLTNKSLKFVKSFLVSQLFKKALYKQFWLLLSHFCCIC